MQYIYSLLANRTMVVCIIAIRVSMKEASFFKEEILYWEILFSSFSSHLLCHSLHKENKTDERFNFLVYLRAVDVRSSILIPH
jgi:hypothetical protein